MYHVVLRFGSLQIPLRGYKTLRGAKGFATKYAKNNKVPVYIMFNNEVLATIVFERKVI